MLLTLTLNILLVISVMDICQYTARIGKESIVTTKFSVYSIVASYV